MTRVVSSSSSSSTVSETSSSDDSEVPKTIRYHFMCEPQEEEDLRAVLEQMYSNVGWGYVINSSDVHTSATIISVGDDDMLTITDIASGVDLASFE